MAVVQTGRESLRKAVQYDVDTRRTFSTEEQLWEKFNWIINRAEHYSEKTGVDADEILNAWEKNRDYWYQNYYQEANQPEIKVDSVRVFDTVDDLIRNVSEGGFRCPCCGKVTTSPYKCNTGHIIENKKQCDWKINGLFGDLGKGVHVFVKEKVKLENIFMPIAWEKDNLKLQKIS